MAENKYQEEGATKIDFVMRNYEYANMAADMGQCRFGFATDLKTMCAKGDSGATVYKFLKDASGSSNTPSTRLFFADADGAASSHASLTFDGTTLKIAGALRKAEESVDNLTLGAAGLVNIKSKLMVGSLDETPENQLSVFKDADESVFLSVGNYTTGQNGIRIGIDAMYGKKAVYDIHYGMYAHTFRAETSIPNVYETIMSLFWTPGEGGKAWVYGDLEIDRDAKIDGDLNVNGKIQCDAFRLDQDPIAGTIIPDKYIIIECNGTNYKIPVVAE